MASWTAWYVNGSAPCAWPRVWSLEDLAARAKVSQSTLSRIENGQRRLALDQLVTLARALDTSLDQLVETASDGIVSSPMIDGAHGQMRWPIKAEPGMTVIRQRITGPPPHNPCAAAGTSGPGMARRPVRHRDPAPGQPAPADRDEPGGGVPHDVLHAIGAEGGPCELLGIFDRDARRGHQRGEGAEKRGEGAERREEGTDKQVPRRSS
ncbi:transcriptional regulator [Streptomyces badius]